MNLSVVTNITTKSIRTTYDLRWLRC